MSTTHDSAYQWVETKNPTNSEIDGVIAKLNQRINTSGASDEQLIGTKEALAYLLQELADRKEFTTPSTLDTATTDFSLDTSSNISFDSSGLGNTDNDIAPKCQSIEEKNQRLQTLMANIKKVESE
jgi:hypothetical protein